MRATSACLQPLHLRERRRDARDTRREQAIGAAHQRVLLMQHGGDAPPRRGEHRRHGRIAAEADGDGGLQAAQAAFRRRACREPFRRRPRPCRSSPASSRPAGMRCSATSGKRSAKAWPRRSVTSATRWPRASKALASASAGNICPPVPPLARMTRRPLIRRRLRSAVASAPRSCPCRDRARAATSRRKR